MTSKGETSIFSEHEVSYKVLCVCCVCGLITINVGCELLFCEMTSKEESLNFL